MYDIIIIGAGAAGMMAAITAGRQGARVCLAEKNEKPGKKLYITGKGRCNLTNACDTEELFNHVISNKKFLYSSFYAMTNVDVIDFFEELGVKTKMERGNRVFPLSDKSSDVIRALWDECIRNKVEMRFHSNVSSIYQKENAMWRVTLADGRELEAKCVIVATGGLSYASTGSDGAGYCFAKRLGHKIKPCIQGLVPMNIQESTPALMQGLSLKHVELSFYTIVKGKRKQLYEDFGEMMFTHFGITGPVVLSASSHIGEIIAKQEVYAALDCKPALSPEKLHKRVLRDFESRPNISLKNALSSLVPKSMIPVVLHFMGNDGSKPVNQVTRQEREELVHTLKEMIFTVHSLRGWNEAIITRGGVCVKEINPTTMESKLVDHLYFAGEVLDVDALTGGYNLQVAWSTGYVAGKSAADQALAKNEKKRGI